MDNKDNINNQNPENISEVTSEATTETSTNTIQKKEQISREDEKAIRNAEKEELKRKREQQKESNRIKKNLKKSDQRKERQKTKRARKNKFAKFFKVIKKAALTVVKIAFTPVTAVTSAIVYAVSPKEVKQQIYQESLKKEQQENLEKTKSKETSKAAKKELTKNQKEINKILSDKSTNNIEKLEKLAHLRNSSKFDFYVMTEKGALQFAQRNKDVIIKHAIPEQPTAESKTVYGFSIVAGATFEGLKKELRDMYDLAQVVDKDGGFSKTQPGQLPENVVVENKENYGNPETKKEDLNIDIDSNTLDEAIVEGNTEKIEEQIDNVLEEPLDINADIPKNPVEEEYDFFANVPLDQQYQKEQIKQAEAFANMFESNNIEAPVVPEVAKNVRTTDDFER